MQGPKSEFRNGWRTTLNRVQDDPMKNIVLVGGAAPSCSATRDVTILLNQAKLVEGGEDENDL
jgi:hypothetical protein